MASKITETQEYYAYELAARLSPKELKELALMRAQLDTMDDVEEEEYEDEHWNYELEKLKNKWGTMNFPERFLHDAYKTSGSLKFLNFVLERSHGISKIAYYSSTERHTTEMLYLSVNAKTKLIPYVLPKIHCRKLGIEKRHWELKQEFTKPLLTVSKATGFNAKFIVHEYFQFLKSYLK